MMKFQILIEIESERDILENISTWLKEHDLSYKDNFLTICLKDDFDIAKLIENNRKNNDYLKVMTLLGEYITQNKPLNTATLDTDFALNYNEL